MKWTIDDNRVEQLGGNGSDYGAWLKGVSEDGERRQHILVQIGQCGDAPEGDTLARAVVDAMVDGLNRTRQAV